MLGQARSLVAEQSFGKEWEIQLVAGSTAWMHEHSGQHQCWQASPRSSQVNGQELFSVSGKLRLYKVFKLDNPARHVFTQTTQSINVIGSLLLKPLRSQTQYHHNACTRLELFDQSRQIWEQRTWHDHTTGQSHVSWC